MRNNIYAIGKALLSLRKLIKNIWLYLFLLILHYMRINGDST